MVNIAHFRLFVLHYGVTVEVLVIAKVELLLLLIRLLIEFCSSCIEINPGL